MGKALLLIVLATSLGAGVLMYQTQRADIKRDSDIASHEADYMAREVAEAGLSVGISEVKLDFDEDHPDRNVVKSAPGATGNAGNHGAYELEIEENAQSIQVVTSTGAMMGERHRVQAQLVRLSSLKAPVIVNAKDATATYSGTSFRIDGADTRPAGTGATPSDPPVSGQGATGNGILVNSTDLQSDFESPLTSSQYGLVSGLGGERSIHHESFPPHLVDIYEEALTRYDADLDFIGNQYFYNETMGSPQQQKLVLVNGDLTLAGNTTGHGVLVVHGNFTMTDDATWNGVVIARRAGTMTVVHEGNARLFGSLYIDNPAPQTFDIGDDGTVTADVPFRAEVEVIGSAISYGGRYDIPVTLKINVGDDEMEPWGDYEDPTRGNVNDGNNPRSYDVSTTYPAGTGITMGSISWIKRKTSYSGRSKNHWQPYLSHASGTSSPSVRVLRDGDPVPDTPGFDDQDDLAYYVSDYVEDDKIKLDPNQVIYLFELGTTNMQSTAADFQDVVVVMTLLPESTTTTTAAIDCSCKQLSKVALIHYPPGNPGNWHKICVGSSAVPAHLDNHDDDYCSSASTTTSAPTPQYLNFTIRDNAQIVYSEEAIGRIAKRLGTVRNAESTRVALMGRNSYDPDRAP